MDIKPFIIYLFRRVFICGGHTQMWGTENNLQESVLSSHHADSGPGSGDQTQAFGTKTFACRALSQARSLAHGFRDCFLKD